MGVTRSETVDELRTELEGAFSPARGRVAVVATTDSTLTFEAGGEQVRVGDKVELDNEVVYIESEIQPDIEFGILRAERRTTAASHVVDTTARINGRWFNQDIINRLWDEIIGLPTDFFAVTETDLAFAASEELVNLTTDATPAIDTDVTILGIRQAYREAVASSSSGRENKVSLVYIRDTLNGGKAQLKEQGWSYSQAVTVRAAIAHTFDLSAWADGTDLEVDIGLAESMIAGIRLGTMARMQSTRELAQARVGAIGQSSEREDVPIGINVQLAADLRSQRDDLYEEERARLVNKWPRLFRRP